MAIVKWSVKLIELSRTLSVMSVTSLNGGLKSGISELELSVEITIVTVLATNLLSVMSLNFVGSENY